MARDRNDKSVVAACVLMVSFCTMGWGQVIYVDDDAAPGGNGSSWANACRYLQDALGAAAAGAKPMEVRVAQGTYRPDQGAGLTPGDQAASFRLRNGVALRGGYAGATGADPNARDVKLYETVLSGDLPGNDDEDPWTGKDNSCRVVVALATDETAVIDGFTITAAGAPWGPCGDEYGAEAGVALDAARPLIQGCHFQANHAPAVFAHAGSALVLSGCTFSAGEGVVNFGDSTLSDCVFSGGQLCNEGGRVSLSNCTFDRGSIFCPRQGSLTLTGCILRNSKPSALELWDNNTAVLADCLFERNGQGIPGAAIHAPGRNNLTLEDCRFLENDGGAIVGGGGCVSLTRCSFVKNRAQGTTAVYVVGGHLILRDCEFLGNLSRWEGSAVYVVGDVLKATGCVFAGNRNSHHMAPAALSSHATVLLLSNSTFFQNYGMPNAIWCKKDSPIARAELTHCIVWDGPYPFTAFPSVPSTLRVTYSDIQGGYPGEGNISVDPCFVAPGHWADPNDPNIVLGPEDANAVWVTGDYHLKSQAGHWDRGTEAWVCDEVTSACIDAGDPNAPVGQEPFPNGAVLNLGAYGGTSAASKSYFGAPPCETQLPGDLNGDCLVDATDAHILAAHWPVQTAERTNVPPSVLLSAPESGAEISYPATVIPWADATDPDGYVASVTFVMRDAASGNETRLRDTSPAPWTCEWYWWRTTGVPFDGVYEIWAEAMDDGGAVTVSPKIKVTLRVLN